MTETWCALLNVLILSIVAGANGVLLARTRNLTEATDHANRMGRRTGEDA